MKNENAAKLSGEISFLRSKVLVLRSTESSVYSDILKIFDFFPNSIGNKPKKIAIKLNLCTIKPPESGAVSHPIVVEALLRVLREKLGSETEISLVESDAAFNRNASVCFKVLGFEPIAEKYGARFVNLSDEPQVKKPINGYLLKEENVPRILLESDLLISLPKLKTHYLSKITCGLKNQFGCFHGKVKYKFHDLLDLAIPDANLCRKPDFVLVDGIIGQGGVGSLGGYTKRFNLLVGSDDVVAADCVCAKILGFNPYFVGHIRKSAAKGLGSMKYDVYGEPLKTVGVKTDFDKLAYYYTKLNSSLDGLAKRVGI